MAPNGKDGATGASARLGKGYFGVGVERSSKLGNAGNLLRTTHAFGGQFFVFFTPVFTMKDVRSVDTSSAADHLPIYHHTSVADYTRPTGLQIVGVELVEDGIALPSFRHPRRALYLLGPEKGSLSAATQAACDFIVHIPMSFCVNVGVAGAIMLYDRMLSLGRFAERPVRVGGPTEPLPDHVHGRQILRSPEAKAREADAG